MIPLLYAQAGKTEIIKRIGGNLIVKVKESRVAVSSELARRIMI